MNENFEIAVLEFLTISTIQVDIVKKVESGISKSSVLRILQK